MPDLLGKLILSFLLCGLPLSLIATQAGKSRWIAMLTGTVFPFAALWWLAFSRWDHEQDTQHKALSLTIPGNARRASLDLLEQISTSFESEDGGMALSQGWDLTKGAVRSKIMRAGHEQFQSFNIDIDNQKIMILRLICKTARDEVESGRHHIYRGRLSLIGLAYQAVAMRALSMLMDAGDINEGEYRDELSYMADAIRMA